MSRSEAESAVAGALRNVLEATGPACVEGIGVDVVLLEEWLDRPLRLEALFTSREIEHATCGGQVDRARLAGTWCAKEAVLKAVGGAGLSLRDIEVLRCSGGAPEAVITPARAPGGEVRVSITHATGLALAVAVVVGRPSERYL